MLINAPHPTVLGSLPNGMIANNSSTKAKDPLRFIKYGIWVYFFFLIFEGALRKWFLPSLSAPLLIVRDPVGITLIFMAMSKKVFPWNSFILLMTAIALIGCVTAMLFGHHNIFVTVYGERLYLIHFPLIFVIGNVFTQKDVINMGKVTLLLVIPITVLVGLQFYSPQTAWVNRGVGGDVEGAGFTGALDYMRPPGTFSFTNGNTLFYGFAAAFVVYFWISAKKFNKLFLILSTGAVLLAIPLSISRTLLAEVLISMAFALTAVIRKPKYAGRVIIAMIAMVLVFLILSQVGIFQNATEALSTRFDDAEVGEGKTPLQAFMDRFTAGITHSIRNADKIPFFGKGVGMGTNVGALFLSGEVTFLIAEGEWGRIIGEMGFFFGTGIILLRVSLVIKMGVAAYRKVVKGDLLAWMLLSFGLLAILNGQWGQPTSLGFSTITGGLILAAMKDAPLFKRLKNIRPPTPIVKPALF